MRSWASISIVGPGASLLTIDASGSDITPYVGDGQGFSIFEIGDATDELLDVSISGMTLTGGDSQYGGAILTTENLTLASCTIANNHAAQLGGGVAALYGSVHITDCLISGNTTDGTGGGVAASSAELIVENTTITDHIAGAGGGIHAYDTDVSIFDSTISNNTAWGLGGAGGGIYHKGGELTVANSTVSGNISISGGGIYSDGDAEITRGQLIGNYAYLHGGAIYSFGTLKVRGTTISSSSAGLDGGAIHAAGDILIDSSTLVDNSTGRWGSAAWVKVVDGTLAIVNSTVSNNSADNEGGGVWITGVDATAAIAHSTIYDNRASHIFGLGGGVLVNSGSLQLDHTIVAHNVASAGPDTMGQVDTQISAHYSLVGTNQDSGLVEAPADMPNANGNLIGGPVHGVIDPKLGPLADNGGFTLPDGSHILTHALLASSPAINAGDLNAKAGANDVPKYDQRNIPFNRVVNGRIDIGAFEFQEPSDLNLFVDTLVDESDGNYSRGDLSLREAVELGQQVAEHRYDSFRSALAGGTIKLLKGELKITDDVSIDGLGAELLTIDASGNDPTPTVKDGKGTRIFNIDDGNTSLQIAVTISGLKLIGGDALGSGGAVFSRENMTIKNAVIAGNAARESGGGIAVLNGNLSLLNSNVSNNRPSQEFGRGGGIYFLESLASVSNVLEISRSSITGNSAFSGAGLFVSMNVGVLTLTDNTIAENIASGVRGEEGAGGGIRAELQNVSATISRNTIRDNRAPFGGGISVQAVGGQMLISQSMISGNQSTALAGRGGGIRLSGQNSTTTIEGTTVQNNSVAAAGLGGGLFAESQNVVVNGSTFAGNFGGKAGGAIYNGSRLVVTNSTITGNSTTGDGGAIRTGQLAQVWKSAAARFRKTPAAASITSAGRSRLPTA